MDGWRTSLRVPEPSRGSGTQLSHVLYGVAALADITDVASGLSATARRDSKWLCDSHASANGENVGCQTWTRHFSRGVVQ